MKPNFDMSVSSPVRPKVFRKYITGYDPEETNFVLSGFKWGFQLHYQGDHSLTIEIDNMPPAKDNPELVWNKISVEVEKGRVCGPYDELPFQNYVCSPLGLVPKAGQIGKYRLIFNLSAGIPYSINEQTPAAFKTTRYHNLDEAIALTHDCGVNAKLGKSDLEAVLGKLQLLREIGHFWSSRQWSPRLAKTFTSLTSACLLGVLRAVRSTNVFLMLWLS